MCVRERERERDRQTDRQTDRQREREKRERERERIFSVLSDAFACRNGDTPLLAGKLRFIWSVLLTSHVLFAY